MSIALLGQNENTMSWCQNLPLMLTASSVWQWEWWELRKESKQKCDLSQWHPGSATFLENNARHGDSGGADRLVQNTVLGKILIQLFLKCFDENETGD